MRRDTVSPFNYAKGKLFAKIILIFVCSIGVGLVMLHIQDSIMISAVPGVIALLALAAAGYYIYLFRAEKVEYCLCRVVDKKKDIVGGLRSGLSFNRNRYFFEYRADDGTTKHFWISRSGFLHGLAVGQSYMVLYRRGMDPSADNCIEYVSVDEDSVNAGQDQTEAHDTNKEKEDWNEFK